MLTLTTSKEQFIAQLQKSLNNRAVKNHFDEVTAMSDEQWVTHREKLIESSRQFVQSGELARLTADLKKKMRKK